MESMFSHLAKFVDIFFLLVAISLLKTTTHTEKIWRTWIGLFFRKIESKWKIGEATASANNNREKEKKITIETITFIALSSINGFGSPYILLALVLRVSRCYRYSCIHIYLVVFVLLALSVCRLPPHICTHGVRVVRFFHAKVLWPGRSGQYICTKICEFMFMLLLTANRNAELQLIPLKITGIFWHLLNHALCLLNEPNWRKTIRTLIDSLVEIASHSNNVQIDFFSTFDWNTRNGSFMNYQYRWEFNGNLRMSTKY